MRCFTKAVSIMAALQLVTAVSALGFHLDPPLQAVMPFVICGTDTQPQTYALCAEASCFVYDKVAYCTCDILNGTSISLQLSYSSPAGEQNVCDVNQQGVGNGYMVSTFSPPVDVQAGGDAAVYTCPGPANAGSGVSAPVAYAQCDGGICFMSSSGHSFPGSAAPLQADEIICSCPIATGTPGSSNMLGYQVSGPYHPNAPQGARCDASACAACSVSNPTANGTTLQVGSPTGTGALLSVGLNGPLLASANQCLCQCTQARGLNGISCTVARTPLN